MFTHFLSRRKSKSGNDDDDKEEEEEEDNKEEDKRRHERMNAHAPAFVPRKRRGQEEEAPRRTDADDGEGKEDRTLLGNNNHFDEASMPPLPPSAVRATGARGARGADTNFSPPRRRSAGRVTSAAAPAIRAIRATSRSFMRPRVVG